MRTWLATELLRRWFACHALPDAKGEIGVCVSVSVAVPRLETMLEVKVFAVLIAALSRKTPKQNSRTCSPAPEKGVLASAAKLGRATGAEEAWTVTSAWGRWHSWP